MRTNRILSIAAALGFGVSFVASANVVYNSETTNKWFNVNMAELTTEALSASPWHSPENGGEAVVKTVGQTKVIGLDTDLDDPLTYTAEGASADVAVVAAEMTATVNVSEPDLGQTPPQAALTVIGTSSATNWVGLVGDGNGGTEWVTFPGPTPVAGNSYSVRIEFDQRTEKRIRYLIGGVVLSGEGSSDGWYPNPKTGASKISNVSFSGTGDIAALAGEGITENTLEFKGLTQTNGFDYTNGTISISADIQGYENVKAVLKIVDFDGSGERTIGECALAGETPALWNLSGLTAGGTYGYTIEAQVGGKTIATQAGTFTAAKWSSEIWFGADASKPAGNRELNGSWESTKMPEVVDNAYVIEDDALFNVTNTVRDEGTNHVTRVDAVVSFESLVDAESLTEEEDALGGFVAATVEAVPTWMALMTGGWVALTGDIAPEANVQYVVRAEIDFQSASKRVRYLVSTDGLDFAPLALANGTQQWIPLADANKTTLAKVELKGAGSLAKFEARIADKALAEVNGKKYDTMAEAFEAAGTEGTNTIKLLTNATVDPKTPGAYDINPNNHQYASGGTVSGEARAIVVDENGKEVVRPSTAEMNKVKTPGDKPYKNISSLRNFLESHVSAYRDANAEADDIETALNAPGSNGLPLWQDYVMGIEPTQSVTPEYTPEEDTDTQNFRLQVPALGNAISAGKPSGDYAIKYKIGNGEAVTLGSDGIIPVALPAAAANFDVKIVLEPNE